MKPANLGLCNECMASVPSEFVERDGKTWIVKECPKHGRSESLVSTDAAAWQAKRDLWHYVPLDGTPCTLRCENCQIDHKPNMVFLDVTNRCNMNCPICIATIRDMGFDFNPPLEYFEKIFSTISKMDPVPMVELFGGEPTVRDDLPKIISIGRKYGVRPRIVTNGIRLADEEYCRKLCETSQRLRFAFDGRNADIYEKLRHNRPAYEMKMKALENLKKYSRRRHAFISCAAYGFNDKYIPDMFQYIHENRDLISEIGIIPLTENWEPGEFDSGVHTTSEDVEKMIQQSIPGGNVEFVPAGLTYSMRKPRSFFRRNSRSEILLLGGVHPNCESITLLVSDGKTYRSVNQYLNKPFTKAAEEFVAISAKIDPKLSKLDRDKFFHRQMGKLIVLAAFVPWAFRTVKMGVLFGGAVVNMFKNIGRKLSGAPKAIKHRRPSRLLRVAVLPFEEYHSIDAARMESCKAVFAYEDVTDGQVKTIPACTWYHYRNPLLEKISQKYGVVSKSGEPKQPSA